ncbi:MAG: DoxX family protein [Gemmatirosa sp.]|nr:DoxX family protein [Gemmatirosa sp.]
MRNRPTSPRPHVSATTPRPARLPAITLSLLRIVTGLLFMQHVAQKLLGWFADPARPWTGAPPVLSQLWIAGMLETFGGALVVVGLCTRPVAFLLSGEMAVAYFQVHFPRSVWPIMNRGENVVLFCFVFLYLSAAGAGPASVDALLRRRTGVRSGMRT